MKKNYRSFVLLLMVTMLLAATIALLGFTLWGKGEIQQAAVAGGIAILTLVFAIPVAIKRYNDAKKGFPLDDERSKNIGYRAGYYTFLLSLYMWLGIIMFGDNYAGPHRHLIEGGIVGMVMIFALSYAYCNSVAKPE